MNDPKFIVIHHSATPDGKVLKNFDSIKRFHTSWRKNGEIIPEGMGRRLREMGDRFVIPPWPDIGYHAVIEYVDGKIQYFKGRDFRVSGAHCPHAGMNHRSVGVCVVGNFDHSPPPLATLYFLRDFCYSVMVNWVIPASSVIGHREAGFMDGYDWAKGQFKTCPGKLFPMTSLRGMVEGRIDDTWSPSEGSEKAPKKEPVGAPP